MTHFEKLTSPKKGIAINFVKGVPQVPDHPIIPFIRGDGTGIDIWPATQKVIDEGTNDFDVTASANGSTITFTFKSRSGTKSYTPRVLVEAIGQSINDTYA